MSGVILNARGARSASRDLTIILPRSAAQERVPFRCTLCGARFTKSQAELYERHVGDCARKNIDEIRANAPSARRAGTPFDPNNWDPEVERHMLAVGRRMIAERRLEVKPHERAGDS